MTRQNTLIFPWSSGFYPWRKSQPSRIIDVFQSSLFLFYYKSLSLKRAKLYPAWIMKQSRETPHSLIYKDVSLPKPNIVCFHDPPGRPVLWITKWTQPKLPSGAEANYFTAGWGGFGKPWNMGCHVFVTETKCSATYGRIKNPANPISCLLKVKLLDHPGLETGKKGANENF